MSEGHGAHEGGEGGGGSNAFVDTIFWILLILVAYSVIKGMFTNLGISFGSFSLTSIFEFIFDRVQVYSIFFSLLFLIGIIYFRFKLGELAHHSHHRIMGHGHGDHGYGDSHGGHTHENHEAHSDNHVDHDIHNQHASHGGSHHTPDKRWAMVETRLSSLSEGDWRLAVIESDIILNDMLTKMGLPGNGVAEKLKSVDKSAFHTLDDAWDAHKVRNRIAHDGASFHLSHEEAARVVGKYKKVFDEFYFI